LVGFVQVLFFPVVSYCLCATFIQPPNPSKKHPQQIIYLDADNIPLRDPTFLLYTAEYNETRALFWQDFWTNTMAPQVGGWVCL